MTRGRAIPAAVGALALLAPAGRAAEYHPTIDPAAFSTRIDNPYHPLVPGTSWILVEKKGKHTVENEITVTRDTRVVMGVTCVVVHDVVREKGKLEEETLEWFAQDKDGNVWYFGEDTKEYGPGKRVSIEGSWEAGIDKGQPGIIMLAHPAPGPAYRQEYGPGAAEDMAQVIATDDSVTTPYGTFAHCVRTKEWSLLESGSEKKWYAKGFGCVREESASGEVSVLISRTGP
jgi:hypothetical protein